MAPSVSASLRFVDMYASVLQQGLERGMKAKLVRTGKPSVGDGIITSFGFSTAGFARFGATMGVQAPPGGGRYPLYGFPSYQSCRARCGTCRRGGCPKLRRTIAVNALGLA